MKTQIERQWDSTVLLKHLIIACVVRLHGCHSQALNTGDDSDWWGRTRSGCGAVALHHPARWCSGEAGDRGAGAPSLTPWPGLSWKGTKGLQPNVVNKQAGGHQRMTWPHIWQQLLCYVSPDMRGVPDNCSNSHLSLLPYRQLLVYQIERTCTKGTHLKRFLPPPQSDQERFLSVVDWGDKNSLFSFQQFRTQPTPKQVGSF